MITFIRILPAQFALRTLVVVGLGLVVAWPAYAETLASSTSEATLPPSTIIGNYGTAVGSSDAASSGTVTRRLIEARPTQRPAEILEFIPGIIVSQHSGDGKANQYYLRGFNLDHGTDFATFVDAMPINMPTHAHGHGYTDLNWLIPELVDRVRYRKGPYYADDGDFASAGSARISLIDRLPSGLASLSLGDDNYRRALLANSTAVGSGHLLYAGESTYTNGPWVVPERFRRVNGLVRFSHDAADVSQSLTAMAYTAKWMATDQIPNRAIDSGQIDRFGAIDPSDHGKTERYSLSYQRRQHLAQGDWQLAAYAIASRLNLFSNFTYFLDDPEHGDQFEQAERRLTLGAEASYRWQSKLADLPMVNRVGASLRHDRLAPIGLYSAEGGVRRAVTQESRVRTGNHGFFAENQTRWLPWLRSLIGIRNDRFDFTVDSSIAGNSGRRHDSIVSPKLSLIVGPWHQTELFINRGNGFHSSDARGVNSVVSPKEGLPIDPTPGLVKTRGHEIGVRSEWIKGVQSSLSLWQLKLDHELVFSGDAGDTEASGTSRRRGIEFSNHYIVNERLMIDADITRSTARFVDDQGDPANAGRYVPGSVATVVSLGATLREYGPWFGQLHLRYFGPRPLIEDNSQRSKATTLTYLRTGYRLNPTTKIVLDVFNLFNRQASDIDYYYWSRLAGEATASNDIHSHPAEARKARLSLIVAF